MKFDRVKANQKVKRLKFISIIFWFLTMALFVYPILQWIKYGEVAIDLLFLVSTISNVGLLIVSVKVSSKIKFTNYQIEYFSSNEVTENE